MVSEVGVKVKVVLEMAPVDTLPEESTKKNLVEPVELVISKISPVGEPVEVCLTVKPVVDWPVGEMVLTAVEEGLLIRQVVQDDPEILAQTGSPAVVVKTWPEVPIPKLVKVVAPEAYKISPVL